jgi:hypothetical protein
LSTCREAVHFAPPELDAVAVGVAVRTGVAVGGTVRDAEADAVAVGVAVRVGAGVAVRDAEADAVAVGVAVREAELEVVGLGVGVVPEMGDLMEAR